MTFFLSVMQSATHLGLMSPGWELDWPHVVTDAGHNILVRQRFVTTFTTAHIQNRFGLGLFTETKLLWSRAKTTRRFGDTLGLMNRSFNASQAVKHLIEFIGS